MLRPAKQFVVFIILLLAVAVLASVCCWAADGSAVDPFKINKLLGRGVNLGNALEAPNEGEWGVTLKEEYFDIVKQAGFNSIRLPVRWSAHAMEQPPYTIDPNFFKRVDWAINCALSRKMPIVLNMHNYLEFCSAPENHRHRFAALWKQIAEHYRDYPDNLYFELLNEPQKRLTPRNWNFILKENLAVVRQSNPNRIVIIGPAMGNTIEGLSALDIPKDDRNIIVTVHYYDPLEFTHQGATFITDRDANAWLGTTWTGSDPNKQVVVKAFDSAAAWAKENNRPIYLGEFGTYRKADMDSRIRWAKFVADTAVERGFSIAYWEFCAYEFGLYDQQTKSWRKPLLDAVIPPKP